MKIVCGITLLVVVVIGHLWGSGMGSARANGSGQSSEWHYSSAEGRLRGVCILVHGLNLNPERMNPLRDELCEAGIDVLQVHLAGHGKKDQDPDDSLSRRARLQAFRKVTLFQWMAEMQDAYRRAHDRTKMQDVPLYYVGFSMGGLLGPLLMVSEDGMHFEKMVLLAPALRLRPRSYLVRPLFLFSRLVIPSRSPAEYRANPGTPIAAYNAMFQGIRKFNRHTNDALDVSTLVFLDKQDEFVSYRGLQELITRRDLQEWRLIPVAKDEQVDRHMYHHLIIDEASLGSTAFSDLSQIMRSFLRGDFPVEKRAAEAGD